MALRLLNVLVSCLLLNCLPQVAVSQSKSFPSVENNVGGFSIIGWDSLTGDIGIATASKFLGAGSLVPHVKAGVGAIITQAWPNVFVAEHGLELLQKGLAPKQVVESMIQFDADSTYRQYAVMNIKGESYGYTGTSCYSIQGTRSGYGYMVIGNTMVSDDVITVMAKTFEITPGILAERLLSALEAGDRIGGDRRGRQSAALVVCREHGGYGGSNDRFVDLRVDDDSLPVPELSRLYNLWQKGVLIDAQMRTIASYNEDRNYLAAEKEKQQIVSQLNSQLREKPDDVETMNRVAWTLATYEINLPQALEIAKRAAKLAPDKLHILNTLAECHFRLRHFDEAISIGSELVAKDPSNDMYWKQLQKYKEGKQNVGRQ